ncbi:hypothetical protein FB451DRAFT_581084 [Mycena latifolia]|nr:hypothetical protein FB451DRAFT_581084 [Mycena latifolia]
MATTYDPYDQTHTPPPQASQISTLAPLLTPDQPLRTAEKAGVARSSRTQEAARTWGIILMGISIVLAVLLVVLGLIVQVFVVHLYHITAGAIYTTAPLGTTLAIAHISSVVIAISVPLAIGLGGYWLAGRWLASSYDDGVNRPTPYQLGILMKTLNGANLAALWAGSNYLIGRGVLPGGKTLGRPPILRHAVFMLFSFLALAYATSGVETWLGTTSEAVLYPVTTTTSHPGEPVPTYGRQVNQTLCDEEKDSSNNKPYQCGLVKGSGGNPQAESQFILAMNGVSDTNVVALTNDSTAIMVPPASGLSVNLAYTATTLGVKSVCTSVTAQCIDPHNLGPNAGLITNCAPSVGFNTSSLGCNTGATMNGGPLASDGTILQCGETANSTDFRFGIEVVSYAYNINTTSSGEKFVGDTGFFLHGNVGGTNILTCEVKSLVVTYSYFNGSYALLSSSPSDLAQAQRISDGSRAGPTYVPAAIEGVGLYSGNYADSFAARLSLVALSDTAYVIEPTEALETQFVQPNIGSRIPLAPCLLLFILAFVYCVSVVAVTFMAARENLKSPHTSFARSRLVDPVTAISTAYGPDDSKLKRTHTVEELFGNETVADRLTVVVGDGLPVIRRSHTLGPTGGKAGY